MTYQDKANRADAGTFGAEDRITEFGIRLPSPPTPFGSYVEAVQTGSLLYLSGMLPVVDHKPAYVGTLGSELNTNSDEMRPVLQRWARSPQPGITWKPRSSQTRRPPRRLHGDFRKCCRSTRGRGWRFGSFARCLRRGKHGGSLCNRRRQSPFGRPD